MAINFSGQSKNKIGQFNRITANDLTSDLLTQIVNPGSWNRAITQEEYGIGLGQFIVDVDFVKQVFTASGTIEPTTNLAVTTGNNALEMPTVNNLILEIKSLSGTATLDPGTNTIANGNTVVAPSSRRFNLEGTVWIEL